MILKQFLLISISKLLYKWVLMAVVYLLGDYNYNGAATTINTNCSVATLGITKPFLTHISTTLLLLAHSNLCDNAHLVTWSAHTYGTICTCTIERN